MYKFTLYEQKQRGWAWFDLTSLTPLVGAVLYLSLFFFRIFYHRATDLTCAHISTNSLCFPLDFVCIKRWDQKRVCCVCVFQMATVREVRSFVSNTREPPLVSIRVGVWYIIDRHIEQPTLCLCVQVRVPRCSVMSSLHAAVRFMAYFFLPKGQKRTREHIKCASEIVNSSCLCLGPKHL